MDEPYDPTNAPTIGAPSAASGLPQSTAPRAGTQFGAYHLVRVLGQGGFGQVWEAESLETGRRLALKVLTHTRAMAPDVLERFRQEGRLAASLNHPHCVYIFGAEAIHGYPMISMELMAGGTLQDRLAAEGPPPPRQAVDYMLDVLEGLEAAQNVGIIHRDIKPSNCFLDARGRVKIGDFGLSKTLETDAELTMTGAFLGTPSYASPEQVRGRHLDFRSDIYSAGATLYALLTGRAPFTGGNAAEILARIAAEPPAPFPSEREIGRGLQKVVLRALAKDPAQRYPSYEAFRAALLPYSSQRLTAGSLAKRLAAWVIDWFVTMIPTFFISPQLVRIGMNASGTAEMLAILLAKSLFSVVAFYFVLTEGIWGRSLGKYLFGLRVTTTSGSPMTWGQCCVRIGTLQLILSLPSVVLLLTLLPFVGQLIIQLAGLLMVVATMRRRNGYAGLHELLSGTRVRAMRQRESIRVPATAVQGARAEALFHVGPYRLLVCLRDGGTQSLWMGRDDVLARDVWVHRYRDAAGSRPMGELAAVRPGRLNWLQGSRAAGDGWDVYEAPLGVSLCDWVARRQQLGWKETRAIVRGLVEELETRAERRDASGQLSLTHVWIDAHGRPRLLDFAAPSTAKPSGPEATSCPDWKTFLHQVLLFCLEGCAVASDQLDSRPPRVPMPVFARVPVRRLCGLDGAYESISALRSDLENVAQQPAEVTRAQRAAPLLAAALPALLPVLLALLIPVLVPAMMWQSDRTPMADLVRSGIYFQWLEQIEKDLPQKTGEERRRAEDEREALRKVMASAYGSAQSARGQQIRRQWPPKMRETVERARSDYASLSKAEVAEARRTVQARFGRLLTPFHQRLLARPDRMLPMAAVLLGMVSAAAVVLAPLFRGGVLLYLFGIGMQRKDGEPAGRIRCLLRALLSWSAVLAAAVIVLLPGQTTAVRASAIGVMLAVASAAAVYAVVYPVCGLADRIAETQLVPR